MKEELPGSNMGKVGETKKARSPRKIQLRDKEFSDRGRWRVCYKERRVHKELCGYGATI